MTNSATLNGRVNGQRVSELRGPYEPSGAYEPRGAAILAATQPVTLSEADLILTRFRLLAKQRVLWLQSLWQAEEGEQGKTMEESFGLIAQDRRVAVTHAEIATHLADRDSPEAEAEWSHTNAEAIRLTEQIARAAGALNAFLPSRLAQIAKIFGLSTEENDLLQACLAVALDPSLARICAYLQDNASRAYVTEDLASRLFGYGRSSIWSADSALFRFELLISTANVPGEPRALLCDPQVRDWMLGHSSLDESLIGVAQYRHTHYSLDSWPIQELSEFIARAVKENGTALRLRMAGQKGSGRRTFAAILAANIQLPLLIVDADGIEDANWRNVFMRSQRQAFLSGCAIAWTGESLTRRAWPRGIPMFPLQFIICEPGQEIPALQDTVERTVSLPVPAIIEREALWIEHVQSAKTWPKESLRSLAERHRLLPGDIAIAGRANAIGVDQNRLLAIESSRSKLGTLAQRIECPFAWDDLVVSANLRETLSDFEFEARHRLPFWERPEAQRLFPQGRGLLALMSGPPGTGKTMAAQVIAASLGYDLYRVNLATVISKWVGETSQNLERILTRAATMDAILLFDEADALFSKRATEVRDAQDRFANTDSAYLLQAIEAYPGIAILTTNQKGSIDPAFLRRLRFVLEFAKPNAAEQEQLWRKAIGGLAGSEILEKIALALKLLASNVESTGAQIKNAVLGAMFIAQREECPLSIKHLLRSLERELYKEGRALGARERERIVGNAK